MLEPSSELSILALEDSDEDFNTIEEALERSRRSNRLLRATTGEACLALLRSHGGQAARPGIVLLDLNTPGLDGREALREIRADRELCALPVVVLSTSANPRDVDFCYRSGANAYHVKPTQYPAHLELLIEVLHYWLTRSAMPQGGVLG
jgi:CheY-like chemotaxis protein